MWSLNAMIPRKIAEMIHSFGPELNGWEEINTDHTLVIKRFQETNLREGFESEMRLLLEKTDAFEIRIKGMDIFSSVPKGSSPVLYIEIESKDLRKIHGELIDVFGVVEGLEGKDYIPHITFARGHKDGLEKFEKNLDATDIVRVLEFWDREKYKSRGKIFLG